MCDGGLSIKCTLRDPESFEFWSEFVEEMREVPVIERPPWPDRAFSVYGEYIQLTDTVLDSLVAIDEYDMNVRIARVSNWTGKEFKDLDENAIEIPLYMAKAMAKQILKIDGPDDIKYRGAGFYPDENGFSITMGDKV